MFYSYLREFYNAYEPAEGGYSVLCSRVYDCKWHSNLEDAVYELLDTMVQASEYWGEDMEITYGSWVMGLKPIWDDDQPETHIVMPSFMVWIDGTEYELGISCDKPEDEPYEGYC